MTDKPSARGLRRLAAAWASAALLAALLAAPLTALAESIFDYDIRGFWYLTKLTDGVYRFEMSLSTSNPSKPFDLESNQKMYLELSRQPDFQFVDCAFPFVVDTRYDYSHLLEVSQSEIPAGTYYYRAAVYTASATDWCAYRVYPSPAATTDNKITVLTVEGTGAALAGYQAQADANAYGDATLGDGTALSIQSVWLRSALNGQPLMPATPPGLDPATRTGIVGTLADGYAEPPFDSFSHGAVVDNGVVYIGVGQSSSFNPEAEIIFDNVTAHSHVMVEHSEPDRTMLYRYDLATGAFLKPVSVAIPAKYPDGTNSFTASYYRMMPWLRTDDAGNVYFPCVPLSGSLNSLNNYVAAFGKLDLSTIAATDGDYDTVTATLPPYNNDLLLTESKVPYVFGTVAGDITTNSYVVWGLLPNPNGGHLISPSSSWATALKRWDIGSTYAKETSYSVESPFSGDADASLNFRSYTPKLYLVDDTHAYVHATPRLWPGYVDFTEYANFEPAFYEIDATAKAATLKSRLSDALPDGAAPASHTNRMSGFPMVKMGDATIAAYGHLADDGEATAVQLVQVVDPSAGFTEGNIVPLWDLYKATGLSKSLFQALDLVFIPVSQWAGPAAAEGAAVSGETLLGHLLVYASGAGMGLYRIAKLADQSNAIDDVADGSPAVALRAGRLVVDAPVAAADILDMQGRTVAAYGPLATGAYPLPALAPGVYLLRTPGATIKFAL